MYIYYNYRITKLHFIMLLREVARLVFKYYLIKEPLLIVLTKKVSISQHVHLLLLQDNKTPLHYAAERGSQASVQVLLDKGAIVDCVDKESEYITTCTFIIITG